MKRRTPAPRPSPAPTPTKRCAIYTRKSTATGLDQAFNSLDAQQEACAAYIGRQEGWRVLARTYDDGGFTGANLERPAFQALLRDVEAGLIDVVVVYKVDRLSRSLLDFAQVMERFNRHGVAFVSVTQNFSTADAMGRLTLNMLMSFAEFEREMIAERTRDKIAAARRKGKWTGGTVPFGYRVEDRRLVPHEIDAPLVPELFRRYLAGESSVTLVQWLNDEGVPLRSQRKPRPRPWTKPLVLRILRNRTYLGLMHHQGAFHLAEHPALVDREVFERVQARLDRAVRSSQGVVHNPSYLVRGALRCGACGGVMTTASTTTKAGRVHRYYRCVTRMHQGTSACPTRQLPAEPIEAFVVEQLLKAFQEGRLGPEKVIPRLEEARALLRGQEAACAALAPQAGIEPEAELRLAAAERIRVEAEDEVTDLGWLVTVLGRFASLWETFTPENRLRLIRLLVQRVEAHEAEGYVRIYLADFMAA